MSDESTTDLAALIRAHLTCSCPSLLVFPRADHLAYWITAAGFGPVRAAETERDAAHEKGYWVGYREGKDEAETRDLNYDEMAARAESAEAALAGLREDAKTLADDLCDFHPGHGDYLSAGKSLRALLAPTPDREEARDE